MAAAPPSSRFHGTWSEANPRVSPTTASNVPSISSSSTPQASAYPSPAEQPVSAHLSLLQASHVPLTSSAATLCPSPSWLPVSMMHSATAQPVTYTTSLPGLLDRTQPVPPTGPPFYGGPVPPGPAPQLSPLFYPGGPNFPGALPHNLLLPTHRFPTPTSGFTQYLQYLTSRAAEPFRTPDLPTLPSPRLLPSHLRPIPAQVSLDLSTTATTPGRLGLPSRPFDPLPTISGNNFSVGPPQSLSASGPTPTGSSSYYRRGTSIRLADGSLRKVEDMKTEDFVNSSQRHYPDLRLEFSTVTRIERNHAESTARLEFSISSSHKKVVLEVPDFHPFFVRDVGWTSCEPNKSLARFSLTCRRLEIGDVCISLIQKKSQSSQSPPSGSEAHCGGPGGISPGHPRSHHSSPGGNGAGVTDTPGVPTSAMTFGRHFTYQESDSHRK